MSEVAPIEETPITEVKEETKVPLSEEQKVLNSLQNEFLQLCAQAGEKQYQMMLKRKELAKINVRLRKINLKASKIMAALEANKPK